VLDQSGRASSPLVADLLQDARLIVLQVAVAEVVADRSEGSDPERDGGDDERDDGRNGRPARRSLALPVRLLDEPTGLLLEGRLEHGEA
jgi:hypothetical protein